MKYITIIILTIVYLLLINLIFMIADIDLSLYYSNNKIDNSLGTGVGLGTDFTSSAKVDKNRWYGHITEFHSDKTISYLELFKIKFLRIPLVNNFNFIPIHISFILLIIFLNFTKLRQPKDI